MSDNQDKRQEDPEKEEVTNMGNVSNEKELELEKKSSISPGALFLMRRNSSSISSETNEINDKRDKYIKNISNFTEISTRKLKSEIEDDISKFKKEVEESRKELKAYIKKKTDDSQIKIVETLGIFVALFTFISTEFQAFKIYQSLRVIAGLSLIMLGGLLIFIIILDIVLISGKIDFDKSFKLYNPKTWSNFFNLKFLFLGLCLIFIISGVVLLSTSREENNINNCGEECIYKNYINTNSNFRF